MKKVISIVLNFIASFLKVNEKKILFETGRDLVDGNPRALYFYLKENCPDEFKTVWIVTKKTDVSELKKGEYAYYKTLKSIYFLATSKYWIRSESIGNIIKKKKNQVYIQTWHGHGALKKMGYDIEYNEKKDEPMQHVKEWDYFISTDQLDEDVIRSSTGYNKKTMMLGAACTDEILQVNRDVKRKEEIKYRLGIKENQFNKKIVFYAPTFREADLTRKDIKIPITKLIENKDIILLVRLHPLTKENIDNSIFRENIINVCMYPNASELLAITDVLISDYSSIIYEFAILDRPIIFYDYDIEDYLKERGLYLSVKKDLPGPVVYTEDDLYETLEDIDEIALKYKEKMNKFNKKYNYYNDGNVCKRTIDIIRNGGFN